MVGQMNSSHAPRLAPYVNPVVRPLLPAGARIGPDVLLTARERMSGLPHSAPMTLRERLGKREVISPFGETDWARNLRVAGKATIRRGRRSEEVTAVELGRRRRQRSYVRSSLRLRDERGPVSGSCAISIRLISSLPARLPRGGRCSSCANGALARHADKAGPILAAHWLLIARLTTLTFSCGAQAPGLSQGESAQRGDRLCSE
jgi:hypothetical protein